MEKSGRRKHTLLRILGAITAALVLAAVLSPWKLWLEDRLVGMMQAKGLQNAQLTVDALGLKGISLKDISVGSDTKLTLDNLTLGYSLPGLWRGDIRELTLSGLTLQAVNGGGRWTIAGLDNLFGDSSAAPLKLPVTQAELAGIPLDRARLEKSRLSASSGQWQAQVPLEIRWEKTPVPKLSYRATGLSWKKQALEITAGDASVDAALDEKNRQWAGTWQLKDIAVKGLDAPIPVLQGSGTLRARADDLAFEGQVQSADHASRAAFSMDYPLGDPDKSRLTVGYATVPWNSGTLSVRDLAVPLAGKKPIRINIKVEHVSIDSLMQSLTGKRASATGVVSGMLPVTIAPDGSITIEEGKLQSEGAGTITVAPEAIPGDNQQVALVREVLKNLHYTGLSIALESGKDHKLSVLLTLEGNNPDVYKGRAVKLNVHLTGDVLDLIQQSMVTFTDPKKLLRQKQNEK